MNAPIKPAVYLAWWGEDRRRQTWTEEHCLVGEAGLHPLHLLLAALAGSMVRRKPGHGIPRRNHQVEGKGEVVALHHRVHQVPDRPRCLRCFLHLELARQIGAT